MKKKDSGEKMKHVLCKRLIGLLLCPLLLLAAGCAVRTPPEATGDALASSTDLVQSAAEDAAEDTVGDAAEETALPLSMVAAAGSLLFYQYAGTEDGCYEVITHLDGTANILYTDYASKIKIYLSAQPQSAHNTEDDTSFISSMMGGLSVFCSQNKLYVAKLGEPDLVRSRGEDGRAYFLQMNFDGSDRKTIYLSNVEAFCLTSGIARDAAHLYYMIYHYNSGDSMSADSEVVMQLIELQEDSGKQRVIRQFGDSTAYRILGVWSQGLVISKADRSGNRQILLYDLENDLLTESPSQDCLNYRCQMVEDILYYWVPEQEALYACNVETGEKVCLGQDLLAGVASYDSSGLVGECHDGHLFISCTDSTIGESWKFAFDLATRELLPLTLRDDKGNFVGIYAENSAYFFVKTGDFVRAVQDSAPDGTPFLAEQILLVNSLIKKEDYWNNRPNFIPIESEIYES